MAISFVRSLSTGLTNERVSSSRFHPRFFTRTASSMRNQGQGIGSRPSSQQRLSVSLVFPCLPLFSERRENQTEKTVKQVGPAIKYFLVLGQHITLGFLQRVVKLITKHGQKELHSVIFIIFLGFMMKIPLGIYPHIIHRNSMFAVP